MIITDLRDKIKGFYYQLLPHEEAIWWLLLLAVIGALIGGIWQIETEKTKIPPITIEKGLNFAKIYAEQGIEDKKNKGSIESPTDSLAIETTNNNTQSDKVVVSKKGKKYHYLWCASAKAIKPENRIYLNNEQEAISLGYTKAGNCK